MQKSSKTLRSKAKRKRNQRRYSPDTNLHQLAINVDILHTGNEIPVEINQRLSSLNPQWQK